MNKGILVSIITVSFNSEKTIRNTIESVLNQTYNNIEYIIIDGNSTDKTLEIVKEYEEKFKNKSYIYRIISEKDDGIYDAMNKGIRLSNGELIGIINSDDNYEVNAVVNIVNEYNIDNNYYVYHGLLRYYNDGQLFMIRGSNSDVLKKHMIEHPACFVAKKAYEEIGLFDCNFRYVADYDFLCRLKIKNKNFKLIDKIIANFHDGGAGDCKESRVEALRVLKKYNYIGNSRYLLKRLFMKLNII
ncbi:MAG: glycosyltransferase family 2 protein [Clostridium sp.]|uniref:glycosyltransferase family 2 protein n=1 Tax=Clostridium sp. TaxID=1506 RepID=UPI002910FE5E|nr:glycosyltransferase family 2 protein [Clostridium sp.]MDU6365062.1 glycosyltransferase family 2 protein [Clostridium sp.]